MENILKIGSEFEYSEHIHCEEWDFVEEKTELSNQWKYNFKEHLENIRKIRGSKNG